MFYLEGGVAFRGEWKRHFLPLMLSVFFFFFFNVDLVVNGMEERKNF